jgi:hypothetical protein
MSGQLLRVIVAGLFAATFLIVTLAFALTLIPGDVSRLAVADNATIVGH